LGLNIDAPSINSPSWRKRLIRYGPLVIWIAAIFFFSSTAASASETSRIIGPLLHFLFPSAPPETLQQYHFFIRKCAHVTEYAVLTIFALRSFSADPPLDRWKYVIAFGLAAMIAIADEVNQSFEPSRTSSPYDVLIDISGALLVILIALVVSTIRKSKGQV
jgi:VanZ family protein